jgi:polysaccharide export outer membrane protein
MAISSHVKYRLVVVFILSTLSYAYNAVAADDTTVTEPKSETAADMPAENIHAADKDYAIQAGDILDISVWKEKDLQKDVLVRPDGEINFPLVGSLNAAGKSIEQLQKELTDKLRKYVPDPSVSIAIKQTQGYKIYVIGKVTRPGEITTSRNMDVMQALSIAGSLTPYASENNIKILRRDENGRLLSIPFKYSRVEKGKDLEQNIILRSGDIVVVP